MSEQKDTPMIARLRAMGMLTPKPPKKNSKPRCPVCHGPQKLVNLQGQQAWVCASETCHYKRPYTTGKKSTKGA